MLIALSEAKQYLRVETDEDDALIEQLISTSEQLCMDVARVDSSVFTAESAYVRIAVLYAMAYLYEHREEADHGKLLSTLRSLLFGIRNEVF